MVCADVESTEAEKKDYHSIAENEARQSKNTGIFT